MICFLHMHELIVPLHSACHTYNERDTVTHRHCRRYLFACELCSCSECHHLHHPSLNLRVEQGVYPTIVVVMVGLEQTMKETAFNSIQFGAAAACTASVNFAHSTALSSDIISQSEGTSARTLNTPSLIVH